MKIIILFFWSAAVFLMGLVVGAASVVPLMVLLSLRLVGLDPPLVSWQCAA